MKPVSFKRKCIFILSLKSTGAFLVCMVQKCQQVRRCRISTNERDVQYTRRPALCPTKYWDETVLIHIRIRWAVRRFVFLQQCRKYIKRCSFRIQLLLSAYSITEPSEQVRKYFMRLINSIRLQMIFCHKTFTFQQLKWRHIRIR
jgi:hypothetical protein